MATAAIPHDDIEDAQRRVETMIRFVDPGDFLTRRYVSAGKEMNTGTYSDHRVTGSVGAGLLRRCDAGRLSLE